MNSFFMYVEEIFEIGLHVLIWKLFHLQIADNLVLPRIKQPPLMPPSAPPTTNLKMIVLVLMEDTDFNHGGN